MDQLHCWSGMEYYLEIHPIEVMEVMEDSEVWRLNLELLPPQPSRKRGQWRMIMMMAKTGEHIPYPAAQGELSSLIALKYWFTVLVITDLLCKYSHSFKAACTVTKIPAALCDSSFQYYKLFYSITKLIDFNLGNWKKKIKNFNKKHQSKTLPNTFLNKH